MQASLACAAAPAAMRSQRSVRAAATGGEQRADLGHAELDELLDSIVGAWAALREQDADRREPRLGGELRTQQHGTQLGRVDGGGEDATAAVGDLDRLPRFEAQHLVHAVRVVA